MEPISFNEAGIEPWLGTILGLGDNISIDGAIRVGRALTDIEALLRQRRASKTHEEEAEMVARHGRLTTSLFVAEVKEILDRHGVNMDMVGDDALSLFALEPFLSTEPGRVANSTVSNEMEIEELIKLAKDIEFPLQSLLDDLRLGS